MPSPLYRALRPAAWLSLVLAAPLFAHASGAARTLSPADVAVLAASCANCHGPDGRSTGGMPTLRGLPASHLEQRMQAFKAGTAQDATVMTRLMKGYDDTQIKALADWFSKGAK
jgi:sulfide dehydrogenase cytochrome subunit